MKTATTLLVVFLLLVAGNAALAEESFRVVVHGSNSADSLTREELSDLYLQKATQWSSGSRALPVDQDERSPVRRSFSEDVHGRSVNAINWYWRRNLFAGSGRVPPVVLASDEQVLQFVATNPTAIGYVSPLVSLEGYEVRVLELGEGGRASS
jgi:ABC-type phosphate transport system substrate-binding protein